MPCFVRGEPFSLLVSCALSKLETDVTETNNSSIHIHTVITKEQSLSIVMIAVNKRGIVYLLTLALVALTGANAQFFDRVRNVTNIAGNILSAVDCNAQVQAEAQCNLAPFSGTFVCREFASFLGYASRRTVCARNIINGLTLGLESDQCGCCDGDCPEPCGCPCGENRVWVEVRMMFGLLNFQRCMTNGMSQHATAWGDSAKCVDPQGESGCPAYIPDTIAPTPSP